MFKNKKTDNFYLYSTDVENFFISDFMLSAPGEYVKAYLLALMYAQVGVAVESNSIKGALGMRSEDMDQCWDYWEEKGVIEKVNDPLHPENGYDIVFVNLRELISGGFVTPEKRDASPLDDKELAKLYKDIQKATGRMLEAREYQEIGTWLRDLSVTTDLICYCYGYCAQNRKSSNYRYVATVLKDWAGQGIRTVEDAEAVLSASDRKYASYKTIFTELGFSRNPSAEEKRIMDSWLLEQGYSMNDVLEACKKTASISNPNLKYVDGVLKNVKGKRTPEEVQTENVSVRINRYYENARKKADEITKQRQDIVFKKVPRVAEILALLNSEGMAQAKALVRKDGMALKASRERMNALKEEKEKLLLAAGFEANVLDAVHYCSKCKDTGILEDGSRCSCYAKLLEKINAEQRSENN